jgi:metallo-beta-lactamase family protein
VDVRAEVVEINGLSSHADYAQTLAWLGALPSDPRSVFITHGEPASAAALRTRIEERFAWRCHVPSYREQVELGGEFTGAVTEGAGVAAIRGW